MKNTHPDFLVSGFVMRAGLSLYSSTGSAFLKIKLNGPCAAFIMQNNVKNC
ncbi:hypothetical protein ACFOG5_22395 [Pedobacter fastidiosus]|uniref:hypothetical protein n=1 Tax=Pedobacter fastidiosus TaxID=2765361 RepID=UPI00361907B6